MNADTASRTGMIIGYVAFVVGGAALLIGFRLYFNARKMVASWLERDARVVRSWISESKYTASTGAKLTQIGYEVNVEVDYELAARRYRNPLRIAFYKTGRDIAERALTRVAGGTALKIFVNPQQPDQIRTGVGWNFKTFLGAIVFGGIGLLFLINGIGLLATKGGGKTIVRGQ